MKIIAVVPMKLNNKRLPQKNTKPFRNGKPLCYYILSTLLTVKEIDKVYVYCSNPDIKEYIPRGVEFLQRSSLLDQDSTSMTEVLSCFAEEVHADVYVMTHTTAPFISKESIEKGLNAVVYRGYDSSFAAKKVQDFLWKDGKPLNYELDRIPRTQDLPVLYEETSGFYIYKKEIMSKLHRRIGDNPFIVEVGEIEAIDIDEQEDFLIADAVYNYNLDKDIQRKEVKLLDCTLRDGGYCNNWLFGRDNIYSIVNGLLETNIDIIECGYISQRVMANQDSTKFNTFEQVSAVLPTNRENKLFVAMINFGEFNIEDVPDHTEDGIDGIRVAFHKKDRIQGVEFCRELQKKGYKVFIQGMVSLAYTDEEYIDLINRVNEFEPYAFYIVDSFGMMKEENLLHLFHITDQNLSETIHIGFHAHNNLQLAYSNCRLLMQMQCDRTIIIDTSIYGMGRGAGNLNTELFLEYLNENYNTDYKLNPILILVDEVIDNFYRKKYWGYSLSNYISAKSGAHPAYASYLDDKKTLTIEDMKNIFCLMDNDKKVGFDKNYIDNLYTKYMAAERVKHEHKEDFLKLVRGRKVLLIAPGKSLADEIEKVEEYAKHMTCISINFNHYLSDFIFLSNLRRYRELDHQINNKCIVTSNIADEEAYIQVKYRDLLNDEEAVRDNAGLMAIKFLMAYGVEEIFLAGFDGYSHESSDNYVDTHLELITQNNVLDAMNVGMEKMLNEYAKKVKIIFLTTARNVTIENGKFHN